MGECILSEGHEKLKMVTWWSYVTKLRDYEGGIGWRCRSKQRRQVMNMNFGSDEMAM